MGNSVIKNPRKLFSQSGGDASLPNRVLTLENNEYKIVYFASISSASGTITIPTGATILLDQFESGADAYVTTIVNGQPSGLFPKTSAGLAVDVTSFDASGNYTLSGTPSSFPVALVYLLKISAKDVSNLTLANEIYRYDIIKNNHLSFMWDTSNPADNITYYIGFSPLGLNTSFTCTHNVAPITGTIYAAAITTRNNTSGSTESVTFRVNVNNTTDYDITTSYVFDNAIISQQFIDNLSIPITKKDSLWIKMVCPAWGTNPTNTAGNIILYIR